jgi:hypothetical protein
MNRVFWIGLAATLLFLTGAVWVSATSTFLYRHPQAPDLRIVMDYRTGGAVVAPLAQASEPRSSQPVSHPQVEIPENTHDFGLMNPLTMGSHAFVIRNSGAAPLKLQVGPTTCKCTVSGLAKKEIAPGEETTVSLDWNTGRGPEFAHSAAIYTNDPERKMVHFTVEGQVRVTIDAEPRELALPAADPGSHAVADVVLHSQVWNDIEVVAVQAGLSDFTWRVENVDPREFPDLHAQSAQVLRIEFTNLDQGAYHDTLQVSLREKGGERTEQIDIPVSGSIKRRLALYGPAINSLGILDLGNINQGEARQARVIAKVRDELTDLDQVEVEVFPEFVTATFQPHASGQSGMYQLVIDVPAGIDPCQYKSNPSGKLTIKTPHPRIGDVELKLIFAIVPRSR